MSDSVELRAATSDDEEWMFALYRQVFGDHISRIWGWSEEWQVADFRRGLAETTSKVIEVDGRRIGFLRFAGESSMDLQLLALAPECHGRGFGTSVIQHLQSVTTRIDLKVFVTNARVKALYRQLGFVEHAVDNEFYSMSWQQDPTS